MRRFTVFALAILFASFSVNAGAIRVADPSELGFATERLNEIDAAMQAHIEAGEVAGISTLVARHGRIVQFGAYGVADLESGTPITEDTVFRIYSMTKPITSTAIMILAEQGKLKLSDPIAKHIPAFENVQVLVREDADGTLITKAPESAPTIEDLLRHTAGLSYGFFSDTPVDALYRDSGVLSAKEPLESLVNRVAGFPRVYEPGTRWHYSVATDVLGRVVEAASSQSFEAFLAGNIFRPLKMANTGFYVTDASRAQIAELYGLDGSGSLVPLGTDQWGNDYDHPDRVQAGGSGLLSTIGDYFRFCQMLANGGTLDGVRILSEDSVDQMGRDQLGAEIDGSLLRGQGFGYGFAIVTDAAKVDRRSSLGEMSWGGMANTKFWIDRRLGIVGVAMTQRIHNPDVPIGLELRELVYGAVKPELAQAAE